LLIVFVVVQLDGPQQGFRRWQRRVEW